MIKNLTRSIIYPCNIALSALLGFTTVAACFAYDNPFLSRGTASPDGKIGAFTQNDTGDCFFLASLLALAQDSDGKHVIESAFHKTAEPQQWQVVFPGLPHLTINITQTQINAYKLKNTEGSGLAFPSQGDPDIAMLEIAADIIWKSDVKPEGLWDDVPMNAVFMFSDAKQLLLWNRDKAAPINIKDIDKYRPISGKSVTEIQVNSTADAENKLKGMVADDNDGISMILIDYVDYHAVAITHIDFNQERYSYLDTYLNSVLSGDLNDLLQGLANGDYAVNYLEITPVK